MTMAFFIPEFYKDSPNVTDFRIYGDDKEIYSYSALFEKGTKPFVEQVNIAGVDDLRLVMSKTDTRYSGADIVMYLDNIQLCK